MLLWDQARQQGKPHANSTSSPAQQNGGVHCSGHPSAGAHLQGRQPFLLARRRPRLLLSAGQRGLQLALLGLQGLVLLQAGSGVAPMAMEG